MNFRPIIIMRATQKKMMSKPVTSTLVGQNFASSGVCLGQRRDLDVPLVREIRLEDGAGAVTARDGQAMCLHTLDETGHVQLRDDALARLEAIEPAKALRYGVVERGAGREDVDLRQAVA